MNRRESPSDTKRRRKKNWIFTSIFLVIIFGQTFHWLFANRVQPFVAGMPFGLFVITALIALEFVCLVLLYKSEQ